MPTFQVTAPNGKIYRVEAPAGATHTQIMQRVQQHHEATTPKPTTMGVGDVAAAVSHGLLGSWQDNLVGADGAARNIGSHLLYGTKYEPGAAFDRARELSATREQAVAHDHPWAHGLIRGVGMTGGMFLPEAKVAQGAGFAARALNGAATAGTYGAIEGFGKGRGLQERTANAATGGLASAAFGGLMPAATTLLHGAYRAAVPLVAPIMGEGRALAAQFAAAQRKVGETIAGAGSTPSHVATQVADAARLHVPLSPSDTSIPMRQLTGATAKGIGPGQTLVQEALARRQEGMAQRVRGHISDTLGSTVNPHAQSAALSDKALADAKPLYDAAYQAPLVLTPGLHEFTQSPTGKQAMGVGARSILDTPSTLRNIGSENPTRPGITWDPELGPGGAYTSGNVPVLESFDKAKQHLDDIVHQNSNPFLAKAEGTSGDTRPQRLAGQELLRNLDAQVPGYAAARTAYAGPTRQRLAFEAGMDGTSRHTADDAASQMSDMTPSEMAQFRLGDRTRLSNRVEGADNSLGPYADASNPIIGNTGKQDVLSAIHGVPYSAASVDQLAAKAQAEREGFLTYKQTFGGSNTSRDAADMADAAAAPDPATLARIGALGLGGRPGLALATGLRALTPKYISEAANSTKAEMARMLVNTNPASVKADMAGIDQRSFRDAHHEAIISNVLNKTAKFFGQQVVGNSGDQTGLYGPTDQSDPQYQAPYVPNVPEPLPYQPPAP